jgi:hypothetical protein
MNSNTLIDVVSLIDTRIKMYEMADSNEPFYQGAIASLTSLSNELQMHIEADIAAMESNVGE